MEDLMKLDACRSPQPIILPQEMQEIQTPLRWQEWDRALESHPNQRFRRYVVEGIKHTTTRPLNSHCFTVRLKVFGQSSRSYPQISL